MRDAPPLPPLAPLRGQENADVVVVGGGVTGCSSALHLAEGGARVALIEANEIGWGGSGRAFGQLVPYTKHSEGLVLKHFGTERGERLITATAASPQLAFDLIERHGIQCDAKQGGMLFAAHSASGLRGLERRAQFWQERGAPVSVIGPQETARLIGSGVYQYALLDKRGGMLNPLAYTRGLAAAALSAGAIIYAPSPMRSMRRDGAGWIVESDQGSIRAGTVLLATDSYSGDAVPSMQQSLISLRAYQLVSKPLPPSVIDTILPERHPMTDTRRLFSGIRVHPSGRLHVSVDGPAFSAQKGPFTDQATARVRKLFPQIGAFEWEESWDGWVGVTTDEYPRLLKIDDGCFGAFGYSGRGLTLGTLLGRELARHVLGDHPDDLALPLTPPRPARVRPVARPLVASLIALYRIRDRIDESRVSQVK